MAGSAGNRRDKDLLVTAGTGDPFQGGAELEVAEKATPARRGHLTRGWVKQKLIKELALGVKMQSVLAEEYGVSKNSISLFKKRYAMEIEEAKKDLANEYAGNWIADKRNRLAELEAAATKMAKGSSPRDAEVLVGILRAASEELGQLPARTQINVSTENVTYQIVGVDPEDI